MSAVQSIPVFVCECGQVCKSRGGLTQHKKACEAKATAKTMVESIVLACDCGREYKRRCDLTRHMKMCAAAVAALQEMEATVAAPAATAIKVTETLVAPKETLVAPKESLVTPKEALTAYEKEKLRLKREAMEAALAVEKKKLEDERRAREEALAIEKKKLEEERRAREEARLTEERRRAEAARLEEARLAEAARLEAARLAEKRRKHEEAMAQEAKRIDEMRRAEAARLEEARLARLAAAAAEKERMAEESRKHDEIMAAKRQKLEFSRQKFEREIAIKEERHRMLKQIAYGNARYTRDYTERATAFKAIENNKDRAITIGGSLGANDLRAYVDKLMCLPESVRDNLHAAIAAATLHATIDDGMGERAFLRLRDWSRISSVVEKGVEVTATHIKKAHADITWSQVQPETFVDATRAEAEAMATCPAPPVLRDPVEELKDETPAAAADADEEPRETEPETAADVDAYDAERYKAAYEDLARTEGAVAVGREICVQALMQIQRALSTLNGTLVSLPDLKRDKELVTRVAYNRARIQTIWLRLRRHGVYITDSATRLFQNHDGAFIAQVQKTLTDRLVLWRRRFGASPAAPCQICERTITCDTYDRAHVVSTAYGGSNADANILLTCRDCNQDMGTCDALLYRDIRKSAPRVTVSA